MSFSINVIPPSGQNLIAQATSSNPIVLVKGLGCNEAAVDAADLISKTASWYTFDSGNADGEIFTASAEQNVCRVVLSFNNVDMQHDDPEPLKSACVLGRLASQTDADAVILAAVSDPDSEATIPDKDASPLAVHVPVNIIINSAEQVETTGAEYASLADLERLVSVHIPGNPSVGQAQVILGEKTFDADTAIGVDVSNPRTLHVRGSIRNTGDYYGYGDVEAEGDVVAGGGVHANAGIYITDASTPLTERCQISLDSDSDQSDVNLKIEWPDQTYLTSRLYVASTETQITGALSVGGSATVSGVLTAQYVNASGGLECGGSIVTKGGGYMAMQTAGYQAFMLESAPTRHRISVQANGISTYNASGTETFSLSTASGDVAIAGNVTLSTGHLRIQQGDLICKDSGSTTELNDVEIYGRIRGMAPERSGGSLNVKIGCIIMVWISQITQGSPFAGGYVGYKFKAPYDPGLQGPFYFCKWNGATPMASTSQIPDGEYVLLSEALNSTSSGTVALAIRVN